MNNENEFWLRAWTVIVIAVVSFSFGMYGLYNYKVIRMAELGYQAISYPGSQSYYYQKVKE